MSVRMRITYHLTVDDYSDAAQFARPKSYRLFLVAAFALGVLFLGVWIRDRGIRALLWGLGVLSSVPVLVCLDKAAFKAYTKKAAQEAADKELTVDFSEQGLHTSDPENKSDTGWSQFSDARESDRSFILYQSGLITAIFPKRAFDPVDVATFRDLLKSKIGTFRRGAIRRQAARK